MTERLVISGFGGQGVMFLGKLIAWAAMREGKHVTFSPAYGAEVRGGTSHCSLIISDKEIASPCVESIDTLIALNAPSFRKFISRVKPKGDCFVNASTVEDIPVVKGVKMHLIGFTEIAAQLGNDKSANMVALGAYLASKKVISAQRIIGMLPEAFKNNKQLIDLNEKAIKKGLENG